MTEQGSDLVLMDSALTGRPDKHLIPEWGALFPRPGPWPSTEAQMYLNLYTPEKAKQDFAVETNSRPRRDHDGEAVGRLRGTGAERSSDNCLAVTHRARCLINLPCHRG